MLTSIRLSDINIHNAWTAVPDGTLVQLRPTHKDDPFIALKCQFPMTHGPAAPALLRFDGEYLGMCQNASARPALDVTGMFEICVSNPAPTTLIQSQKPGYVYRHEDGTLFVWTYLGEIGGWVCIKESTTCELGTVHYQVDIRKLLEIGEASLVPVEVEKNSGGEHGA